MFSQLSGTFSSALSMIRFAFSFVICFCVIAWWYLPASRAALMMWPYLPISTQAGMLLMPAALAAITLLRLVDRYLFCVVLNTNVIGSGRRPCWYHCMYSCVMGYCSTMASAVCVSE